MSEQNKPNSAESVFPILSRKEDEDSLSELLRLVNTKIEASLKLIQSSGADRERVVDQIEEVMAKLRTAQISLSEEPSSEVQSTGKVNSATLERLVQLAQINLRRSFFSMAFGGLILAFGLSYPFLLALADNYNLLKPRVAIFAPYNLWLVVILFSVTGAYFTLKAFRFYLHSRRHITELEKIRKSFGVPPAHE